MVLVGLVIVHVPIKFEDERNDREMTFYFEGGITSFVRYLNRNRENLHSVVYVEKEIEGMGVEASIQYTDAYTESVYSFANTINTIDGGTHLTGLRSSLTRVINDYARKNGLCARYHVAAFAIEPPQIAVRRIDALRAGDAFAKKVLV